ncbi:hypothetical protein KC345_g138 [Hortaea werneckii]|nr:hypothetical protein KC345_g138 [Hortaea werneckii]
MLFTNVVTNSATADKAEPLSKARYEAVLGDALQVANSRSIPETDCVFSTAKFLSRGFTSPELMWRASSEKSPSPTAPMEMSTNIFVTFSPNRDRATKMAFLRDPWPCFPPATARPYSNLSKTGMR